MECSAVQCNAVLSCQKCISRTEDGAAHAGMYGVLMYVRACHSADSTICAFRNLAVARDYAQSDDTLSDLEMSAVPAAMGKDMMHAMPPRDLQQQYFVPGDMEGLRRPATLFVLGLRPTRTQFMI